MLDLHPTELHRNSSAVRTMHSDAALRLTLRHRIVRLSRIALLCESDISSRPLPILFFANKLDQAKSLSPAQLSESLELSHCIAADKPWSILASNALTGQGLDDGIKWLTQQLKTPPNTK